MKLVNLKMDAFGPYLNRQEIAFSRLKDRELFLISGATGSGKTTIFDAICFALYGSVSGQRKDAKILKSDFADFDEFCFVELEFESFGKQYKIKRSPDQFVRKARGDGLKFLKHRAELQLPNGKILTNLKEISQLMIDEIIGIDRNNFDKLVMLPQGQFQKLLIEKGEEQTKTFRKLFGTEIYETIADRIFLHKQELLRNYEDLKFKNREKIQNLKFDFDGKNNSNFEDMYGMSLDELINFVFEKILKDEDILADIRNKIKVVAQEIENLEVKIQFFLKLIEKKKNLENIETELKKLKMNQPKAEEIKNKDSLICKLEKLEVQYDSFCKTAENLKRKFEELEVLKGKVAASESKLDELNKNFSRIDTFKLELSELRQKHSNLKYVKKCLNLILGLDGNIAILKCSFKKLNEELEILKVKQNLIELKQNINLEIEIIKYLKDYIETFNRCVKLTAELSNFNKSYLDACKNFYEQQAELISKNLKDGDICPVCGAKVTFSKFTKPSSGRVLISQSDVEKLREAVFSSKDSLNEAENRLKFLKDRLAEHVAEKLNFSNISDICSCRKIHEDRLNELKLKFKTKIPTEFWNLKVDLAKDIEVRIKEVEVELDKILANSKNFKKQRDEFFAEIPDDFKNKNMEFILNVEAENLKNQENLEKKIKTTEQDRIEAEKALACLKSEVSAKVSDFCELKLATEKLEACLKNELDSCGFDLEKFSKCLTSLGLMKKSLDEEKALLSKIESLELQKSLLEKDLEAFKNFSLQNLKNLKNVKKTSYEKLRQEEEILLKRLVVNKDCLDTFKKNKAVLEELESAYKVAKIMSDVAKGTKKRISFERYVLSNMLNEVLAFANRWLIRVTENRYSFYKMDMTTSKPLSFNILDYFSGKVRHVSSLSGGEMFAASLALSLGLCEVISSKNGGIELQTMLIDEGFGTLDLDYLDSIVKCLTSLKKSGRTIGLISHIPELKSKISSKIQVIKNRTRPGSRIEIF